MTDTESGYQILLDYDSSGKVSSFQEKAGNATGARVDITYQGIPVNYQTSPDNQWIRASVTFTAPSTGAYTFSICNDGTTGSTVSYQYGNANSIMLGLPTAVTAPDGTVTGSTYDLYGRVTQTNVDQLATLVYNYDDGNLETITRSASGKSQTYSLTYDAFGKTLSISVGDRTLAAYEYLTGNGLLNKQTYGNGHTVSFTYDNLGRTKTAAYSDGTVLSYAYTGDGQLHSVTETRGESTTVYLYQYDTLGNLVGSEKLAGGSPVLRTWHSYDNDNRLSSQGWQLGADSYTETYSYDTWDGNLSSMQSASGQALTYGYDGLRRLTTVDTALYEKSYTYRNLEDGRTTGQVSSVSYELPTDQSFGYTYDSMGNIVTYTDANGTVTYTYDDLGQLLSASNGYTYTYDNAGNILSANGHTYTYGDSTWADLLTAVDGETISYDAIGNPTSYYNGTSWSFTWARGRQLATASNGTDTVSYTYDADGLRTSKTVNGTEHVYHYASGKLLRETYGTNTLDFFYDASGYPFALKYNGDLCYYITNLQGDVMSIVDAQGELVAEYEYDPYGNIVSQSGPLAEVNPLRYRGYVFDSETQFYYLQSRYYDPELCRFINTDAQFDRNAGMTGYNLYAYCANSPVVFKDSSGFAIETILDIISAIVNLIRFIGKPSWSGAGELAWDIGSIFIPFIPGSYVEEGLKITFKIASKIDDFLDGSKLLKGTYKQLKKLVKGLKGIEIHHLIEKRFAVLFSCNPNDFFSVALTPEMHQIITNRWRDLWKVDDAFKNFAYGSDYSLITYSQMVGAVEEVYNDMPGILDEVLEWLEKFWKGKK